MSGRVAVTAMAAITSIGDDLASTFENLASGRTGFVDVERFDVSKAANKQAALRVDDASVAELVQRVTEQLLAESGPVAIDRIYFCGTPDEDAPDPPKEVERSGGWDRVYTGACVSSSSALIDAATAIAHGWCRRILVVAARRVDLGTFQVFSSGGAMTKDEAPRPLTTSRSGVLLGEGAAAFLLEAEDAVESRQPLVRLSGWGRAGDGFHAFQPEPSGRGMVVAINRALASATLSPADIDNVSVHGTGTMLSDAAEFAALDTVFGSDRIPATYAPKSSIGHILEGAGLVEAALAARAIVDGRLPLSAGIRPEDDLLFDAVTTKSADAAVDHVLTMNLAFGGSNTALILSRWQPGEEAVQPSRSLTPGRTTAQVEVNDSPPAVSSFIESSFPPAVYDAAKRCLEAANLPAETRAGTAILLLAPYGDQETKAAVYSRLAAKRRLPPPLFVQSTPASIIGRIAQDWELRGGVNTVSTADGLDEPSVVRMSDEMAAADSAAAVLVIRYVPGSDGRTGAAEAVLRSYS